MRIAHFFIDRPVFAAVVSILITLVGIIAYPTLPVAQYPQVAPPTVTVSASYPGASAETLSDTVATPIEQQINGVEDMLYMSSQATGDGRLTITVTFKLGSDLDKAQVLVQNRVAVATPRLPQQVRDIGVVVRKASPDFMMAVNIYSPDKSRSYAYVANYTTLEVRDRLLRIQGVGDLNIRGARDYAMRIWIDPDRAAARGLTVEDITSALASHNVQVAAGAVGAPPFAAGGTAFQLNIDALGRLSTPSQFADIIVKTSPGGAVTRIRDIARVEMGAQDYTSSAYMNAVPAVNIGVLQLPGTNALETADEIIRTMEELKKSFPPGIGYKIIFNPTEYIRSSVVEVEKTLGIALLLVVAVIVVFLQSWRAALIPVLAIPISLIGAFAVMKAFGFSLNNLTLFGLVLAIGIVVDDAIVVVENVERIMSEEGLPPLAATRKAMGQISGAIVGVTVVLVSVFVPLAFFSGAVGNIYRQFSAVMVSSILFSAFLALSLTPALCATLLKPVEAGHHHAKGGFFGWFNRGFTRTAKGYESVIARMLKRAARYLVVYAAIIAAVVVMFNRLPTSFLPNEDQGNILVNVQLPPGATQNRTLEVMKQVEGYMLKQPEVKAMTSVMGFSFSGSGQNAALNFVTLKDWSEREGASQSAQALVARAFGGLSFIRDASVFPVSPPAIRELGRANGFALRLQDRGGNGRAATVAARNQLIAAAAKSPLLAFVRPDGLEDASQLQLNIDRDKASALGVSFAAINGTLSTALGSAYVNDFPNAGRLQRVVVQADAPTRMQPEDLLKLNALNTAGQPVPLSAFASTEWVTGPMQTVRYNGYPAMRIQGEPAPGQSTGAAMAEMERLVGELPSGFAYEWTGQSREEKLSGATAFILFGFSLLAVFLCLAALYESWSIPLAVILVVPLGVLGVLLGAHLRGLENDVFFKVGLITIIGLSAKNAVLIIEFAKDLHAKGRSAVDAVIEAAHLRFRPILMTSLAFILGVLPLVLASGAGSASQRAIGTGVMGGMITATALAVFLVPVFYVVVSRLFKGSERQRRRWAHESEDEPTPARPGTQEGR